MDKKHSLILRLNSVLQSWGSTSNFKVRETNREPTKSGVIGLICAAMGIKRGEGKELIDKLSKLDMVVCVLREGELLKDFVTVAAKKIGNPKPDKNRLLLDKHYLSGADFLVGLSGSKELLDTIANALEDPQFMLFLGRKCCIPSEPILFSRTEEETLMPMLLEKVKQLLLEEAKQLLLEKAKKLLLKKTEQLLLEEAKQLLPSNVRMVADIDLCPTERTTTRWYQRDLPVMFTSDKRFYNNRQVGNFFYPLER